jgi:hypothetical protein
VRLEGLGKLKKKKSTSSGTRTGDLPACSIVPQATTLPHAPFVLYSVIEQFLTVVYNKQNYWVFVLFPSSGILENRKHDISETGSVS